MGEWTPLGYDVKVGLMLQTLGAGALFVLHDTMHGINLEGQLPAKEHVSDIH